MHKNINYINLIWETLEAFSLGSVGGGVLQLITYFLLLFQR